MRIALRKPRNEGLHVFDRAIELEGRTVAGAANLVGQILFALYLFFEGLDDLAMFVWDRLERGVVGLVNLVGEWRYRRYGLTWTRRENTNPVPTRPDRLKIIALFAFFLIACPITLAAIHG